MLTNGHVLQLGVRPHLRNGCVRQAVNPELLLAHWGAHSHVTTS
jgi:hypothetical protein